MKYTFLFLSVFMIAFACQSDQKNTAAKKTNQSPTSQSEPTKKKYTLTPFSKSTDFPTAKIDKMTYKNGQFDFSISGDYQLGVQTPDADAKMCANSAKGQHIHLIVDKNPYAAKYVPQFEHDIADGEHHLLAFLSRSYHESIKSAGANMALKVSIKDKNITASEPITEPTLFYSRPKGTYVGKKNYEKLMLDFFLTNVTLGAEYTVKVNINGEVHTIDKWQPYYIQGMQPGENQIILTLLKNGVPVNSPTNPVTRKFTLKADPAEQG